MPKFNLPVQLNPPPPVPLHYHASFYGRHRVVEGEVSDRLNGKLIIISIIGPIHNTHTFQIIPRTALVLQPPFLTYFMHEPWHEDSKEHKVQNPEPNPTDHLLQIPH